MTDLTPERRAENMRLREAATPGLDLSGCSHIIILWNTSTKNATSAEELAAIAARPSVSGAKLTELANGERQTSLSHANTESDGRLGELHATQGTTLGASDSKGAAIQNTINNCGSSELSGLRQESSRKENCGDSMKSPVDSASIASSLSKDLDSHHAILAASIMLFRDAKAESIASRTSSCAVVDATKLKLATEANAAYIVAACNDLPLYEAALAEAESRILRLQFEATTWKEESQKQVAKLAEAEKEIERLKRNVANCELRITELLN